MARNSQMATETLNVQANALASLLGDGFLDFFDGVQPSAPEDEIADRTLLGSIRLSTPAFTEAIDGEILALPSTDGFVIANGEATWVRVFQSDHQTAVMDVSVGTKDANVIVHTTRFTRGAVISLMAFSHSLARSTPGI